jgi:FkbM family methyltransferase
MVRKDLNEVMDHIKTIGLKPRTVIDVGVAYGTPGLYGKFDNVDYLLIEPLIEYEQSCINLTNKYGGKYIIAAANDSFDTITINVHADLSGSSIFQESEGPHVDGIPRNVPTVTIDGLCNDHNLKGPFLIKIDTQGSELQVLKGSTEILKKTEVIILEAFFFEFYRDIPLFDDIIFFMKKRGFVVYDLFGGIARPLDNALAQVDLVFVKKKGLFRKSSHFASDVQRKKITKTRIKYLNRSYRK